MSGVEYGNVNLSEVFEGDKASPSEQAAIDKVNDAPAPAPEQPRDEGGRFAPKGEKEPKVEEAEQPAPSDLAATPAAQEQPANDPKADGLLAATKAERDKRQRLEKELEQERQRAVEMQRRIAEFEAKNAPDPSTDPDGYRKFQVEQLQRRAWDDKLNLSERYARQANGDELVSEAQQAFMGAVKAQPYLYHQLMAEQDPYGFVVKWHKREKLLAEIGDDPDAYIQKRMQPAPPPVQAPPRSLASATGARVNEAALSADAKPLKNIFGR